MPDAPEAEAPQVTTAEGANPTPVSPEGAPATAVVTRPDWFPEAHWDGTKAAPDMDGLREAMGKEYIASLRPETMDAYQLALPEGTLPDGMEFKPDQNHPMWPAWEALREAAFEHGLPQDVVSKVLAGYARGLGNMMPDAEAEIGKLGDNGVARSEAAGQWARSNLPADQFAFIESVTDTADGIMFVEWLQTKLGGQSLGPGGASPPPSRPNPADVFYPSMTKRS